MATQKRGVIVWHGNGVKRQINAALFKGIRKAVAYTQSRIVKRISVSSRGTGGARSAKKGARPPMRFNHSKAGQPPKADTGKLRQSIFGVSDRGLLIGRVGTTLKYGAMLELGTKRHTIAAKRKKTLAFGGMVGGKWGWVFPKSVNHPGARPRPYILSTVRMHRTVIGKIIVNTARKLLPTTPIPK